MKKLRKKMILVVFLSVVSVFALTLIIVCVSLISYNTNQADGMTQIISIYNGVVPKMQEYEERLPLNDRNNQIIFNFNEESAFRTRYFIVYLNDDMQAEKVDIEHIASVDEESAYAMAESVITKNKTVGHIDEYRFRITQSSDEKNLIIFLDCSESLTLQSVTFMVLAAISVIFTLLITFIFVIFSKRVLKPFEENSQKQKQFITDASHELKTPLAIISANAEVLEYKTGSNEWLSNITGQVGHMSDLINELLTLSKMEEFDEDLCIESVNLSNVVNETINSLNEVFKQKNVDLQMNIGSDIVLNGDAKQLNMLISILAENASKYVVDSGIIKVSLTSSGKYTIFKIFNTAELDSNTNLKHLFDRFYRPDSSRTSSTGGHGIGLSIAKKITALHNGSISAKQIDNGVCFTAEISNNIKLKTVNKQKNQNPVISFLLKAKRKKK